MSVLQTSKYNFYLSYSIDNSRIALLIICNKYKELCFDEEYLWLFLFNAFEAAILAKKLILNFSSGIGESVPWFFNRFLKNTTKQIEQNL